MVFWDRAFMQFAGFTVGKTQSFFDLFTYGGAYSYHNVRISGDTGAAGVTVWAYTAQFGNGFSGTLSLESLTGHNRSATLNAVVDNTVPGFFGLNGAILGDNAFAFNPTNGFRVPEIVANLRVDQAWGFAGISGALHEVERRLLVSSGCSGYRGCSDLWGTCSGSKTSSTAAIPTTSWAGRWRPAPSSTCRAAMRSASTSATARALPASAPTKARCASLQFLEQRGRGLDRGRRVRDRHRGRADPGVECSRPCTSTSGTRVGGPRSSAATSM